MWRTDLAGSQEVNQEVDLKDTQHDVHDFTKEDVKSRIMSKTVL